MRKFLNVTTPILNSIKFPEQGNFQTTLCVFNDIANIMTIAKMRYWENARFALIVHKKFSGFGTELLSNTLVVKKDSLNENFGMLGYNHHIKFNEFSRTRECLDHLL